jgi:predicted PurR-regulated permease PerM
MVKKAITIISICILTIIFGIIEIIYVKNTLSSIDNIVDNLYISYQDNEDDISVFYEDTLNIKDFWGKKIKTLNFIFNHRDLSTITDSITRLQIYTKTNDYKNAICELLLLQSFTSSSYHIMGFNLHNIL